MPCVKFIGRKSPGRQQRRKQLTTDPTMQTAFRKAASARNVRPAGVSRRGVSVHAVSSIRIPDLPQHLIPHAPIVVGPRFISPCLSESLAPVMRLPAKDGATLNRKLRVAVIGGGPSGACAAETLAKGGVETFLIERKMDNCKPCGGAIPICMVGEFDLPDEIIDRKVTKMKMISPSNHEVDVGKTLSDTEWIGMCRREILNGLMMKLEVNGDEPIKVQFNNYADGGKVGKPETIEVDLVIGADGANSRVAKDIGAGEYDYAIAFQERIRIPDDKMKYYENLAPLFTSVIAPPDDKIDRVLENLAPLWHPLPVYERIRIPDDKMKYYENLAPLFAY
eukprot:gene14738-20782_t